jgi:hypothetical protein
MCGLLVNYATHKPDDLACCSLALVYGAYKCRPHNEVSQKNLLGNIEFGGVVFNTKLLNMKCPLYINMRNALNMQNIMPKILAGPLHYLYLTSIVLKNVQ